jgi:hypothetical protein
VPAISRHSVFQAHLPDFHDVPHFTAPSTAAASAPTVAGATNWQRLQATIASRKAQESAASNSRRPSWRPGRQKVPEGSKKEPRATAVDGVIDGQLVAKGGRLEPTAAVALDCEMVGVGLDGLRNALAKVCVVCPFLPPFLLLP